MQRPHWVSAAALSVLMLGTAFGAYYFVYVGRQEEYYKGRNFRMLATLGTQLEEQVKAFEQIMRFYSSNPASKSKSEEDFIEFLRKLMKDEIAQGDKAIAEWQGVTESSDDPSELAELELAQRRLADLRAEEQALGTKATQFHRDRLARKLGSIQQVTGFARLKMSITDEPRTDSCWKSAAIQVQGPKLVGRMAGCEEEHCDHNRPSLEAEVPIADLVELEPATAAFDEILIANELGTVVDRDGRVDSGIRTLEVLVSNRSDEDEVSSKVQEKGEKTKEQDAEPVKQAKAVASAANSKASDQNGQNGSAGKLPEEFELPRSATMMDVEISGITYVVFAQPIASPTGGEPWYAVGMLPYDAFRAQVASIPVPVLNLAVFALCACALLWPFLKLGFGSHDEEIGRFQVGALALSLVAGSCVLVIALMVVFVEIGRQDERDETLIAISQDMQAAFANEIAGLRGDLRDEADALPLEPTYNGINRRLAALPAGTVPPFEFAFAMDEQGMQQSDILKHRKEPVAGCFPAGDRDYFRRIRDGHAWTRTPTPPPEQPSKGIDSFMLERVRARDQGALLYVLAAPFPAKPEAAGSEASSKPKGEADSKLKVVALVGDLRSFSDTVLPSDYGFVVVENETGKTVHRSQNDSWSLVENFLVETDKNEKLEAAIRSHREASISGNYYGRPHRFRTAPLKDTDWSLVVYHSEASSQAAQFELVVTSVSHVIVYLLLAVSLLALANWRVPTQRGWTWMWPRPDLRLRYVLLCVALFNVLVCAAWGISGITTERTPVAVFTQVAGTLACLAFALSSPASPFGDRARLRMAWTTAAVIVSLAARIWAGGAWDLSKLAWMGSLCALAGIAFDHDRIEARVGRWRPAAAAAATWRAAYIVCNVLLLAIVAGVPTVAIFRDALRFEAARLSLSKSIRIAEGILEREERVRRDIFRIDVDRARAYETTWRELPQPMLCCVGDGDTGACRGDDVWSLDGSLACTKVTSVTEGMAREDDGWIAPSFTSWLSMQIPSVDHSFAGLRYAVFSRADDDHWWTERGDGNRQLVVDWGHSQARVPLNGASFCSDLGVTESEAAKLDILDFLVRSLHRTVAPPGCTPGDVPARAGLAAILLTCLPMGLLVQATSRRLVGLGIAVAKSPPPMAGQVAWLEQHHLILGATIGDWPDLMKWIQALKKSLLKDKKVLSVDLREVDEPRTALEAIRQTGRKHDLVLVGPLDVVLTCPARRIEVRKLLEEVLDSKHTKLCVVSEVQPLACFAWPHEEAPADEKPAGDAKPARKGRNRDEICEWARSLAVLNAVDWTPPPTQASAFAPSTPGELLLARECAWRTELSSVEDQLSSYANGCSNDQLLERIGLFAEPIYRHIWETSTKEERLAMLHLARGSYVNTRNYEVIRSLERRRIAVRDPVLRLTSRAFARFARRAEDASRLDQWERSTKESTWRLLRIPLTLMITGGAFLVIYSGRESISAGVAAIPAIVGAIPTVLGLLGVVRGNSGAKSSDA
jgi:hypothetical protein